MAKKDYELVPIKPIKDLQAEIKKLQTQISKKDSSKESVKVLNSNLETQKTIKSLQNTLNKISDKVSDLSSFFEGLEEEEENPHPEMIKRLEVLENQNKELAVELKSISGEIRRLSYFKERLPPGLPVVYKRS